MNRSRFNRVTNDDAAAMAEPPIQLKRLASAAFAFFSSFFSLSLFFFLFSFFFFFFIPRVSCSRRRTGDLATYLKCSFILFLFVFFIFLFFFLHQEGKKSFAIVRAIVFSISQPQPRAAMTDCTVTMRARRPLFVPRFISNVNIAWNT